MKQHNEQGSKQRATTAVAIEPATNKAPDATKTLDSLIVQLDNETTCQKIVFKANLFSHYIETSKPRILNYLISRLCTVDAEIASGFGAALAHAVEKYGLNAADIFSVAMKVFPSHKGQGRYGREKMSVLVGLLGCLQGVSFGCTAKAADAVRLFQEGVVEKLGGLDVLGETLVYKVFVRVQDITDCCAAARALMSSFYGAWFLIQNDSQVEPEHLQKAVQSAVQVQEGADFLRCLGKYLSEKGRQKQLEAVLQILERARNINQYILVLKALTEVQFSSQQQRKKVFEAVVRQDRFAGLVEEALSPQAPLRAEFEAFFEKMCAYPELQELFLALCGAHEPSDLLQSKLMLRLVKSLGPEGADAILRAALARANAAGSLRGFHALVTRASQQLNTPTVLSLIQLLLERGGFPVVLGPGGSFAPLSPEISAADALGLAFQAMAAQAEARALISQISAQLLQAPPQENPFLAAVARVHARLRECSVGPEAASELAEDCTQLLGAFRELLSSLGLLLAVYPAVFQAAVPAAVAAAEALLQAAELCGAGAEEEYGAQRSLYFQQLGQLLLGLARKDSAAARDFCNRAVKNVAHICPDDFFDVFVGGLDVGSEELLELENAEEVEETGEEEREIPEQTDAFSYHGFADAEAAEAAGEEAEEGAEEENDPAPQEDTTVPQDIPADYDAVLAGAVRAIISQRSAHLVVEQATAALRAATFLEILCQNNPGRPVVWEVVFGLLRVAENPQQSFQVPEGLKLTAKDRGALVALREKCLATADRIGLEGLPADALFDGEAFLAVEDAEMMLGMALEGSQVQKVAVGDLLQQFIKLLYKAGKTQAADAILEKVAAAYGALKTSVLRSFIQQLASVQEIGERLARMLLGKVQGLEKDASALEKVGVVLRMLPQKPAMAEHFQAEIERVQALIGAEQRAKAKGKAGYFLSEISKAFAKPQPAPKEPKAE